jgi:CBS domain-containing protein
MGEKKVRAAQNAHSNEFMRCLLKDIKALEQMLKAGVFEEGVERIGAEQEFCFVDHSWRPAPIAMEFLRRANDEHFTTEHAKFNMEINLDPLPFKGDCLCKMERQLDELIIKARESARGEGADIVLVGILPTIRRMDLGLDNLTPLPRYQALSEMLRELRGELFEFRIKGTDELIVKHESTMFEGCNTSFQVHLQVHPNDFVKKYNWAQAVAAPVLAAATNSPMFLGRRLWRETRIALFQQSIDVRGSSYHLQEKRPRVTFGSSWVRDTVLEIFREDIARHRVLLRADITEDPMQSLAQQKVPSLEALRVHNGTIWRWNRPCYGLTEGQPHLRIENRILPAGPTVIDEVANAAFWLGLMKGLTQEYERIDQLLDFDDVRMNFLKASRMGLGARFVWTKNQRVHADTLILKELLPIAREGLTQAKIRKRDIERYLDTIEQRVRSGKTGSQWILDSYSALKEQGTKDEALVALTAAIVNRQRKPTPVHEWKLATLDEAGSWLNRYWRVEQIMSTDLFTAQAEDLVDFAASIMNWQHVRHVPVEDDQGTLMGLVTSGILLRYYGDRWTEDKMELTVGDLMIREPVTVFPETLTLDAIALMRKHRIGCLPVVRDKKVVGIITEHDFLNMSKHLLRELQTGLGSPA